MFFIQNKKIKNRSKNSTGGFLMVELLICSAIIVLAFVASTGVAQKSLQVSRQALHASQASFLLEEGAEAVRIQRDNAWTNLSGLTAGTNYYPKFASAVWSINSTTVSDGTVGIFSRKIVVSNVNRDSTTQDIVTSGGTLDTHTKLITVTVSWSEGATTITKTLPFYLADLFS